MELNNTTSDTVVKAAVKSDVQLLMSDNTLEGIKRKKEFTKEECRKTPEESYHKKLGEMISKVKAETKWRDIFKIVEESQRRLNEKE